MLNNKLFTLDDWETDKLYKLFSFTNRIYEIGINHVADSKYGLKNKVFLNMFLEPSTRTHYSFEVAATKLGMHTIDFNPDNSSLNKSETLYDTLETFQNLAVDCVIIRSKQNRYFEKLNDLKFAIINGGDGTGNHPTQSLLDLYTIYKKFKHFKGLKILIIGDINHSRVARSNIAIMKKLEMDVYISGPIEFVDYRADNYIENIDDSIGEYDIVMLLRYQLERYDDLIKTDIKSFFNKYGLTEKRCNKMKKDAIIMHPCAF